MTGDVRADLAFGLYQLQRTAYGFLTIHSQMVRHRIDMCCKGSQQSHLETARWPLIQNESADIEPIF